MPDQPAFYYSSLHGKPIDDLTLEELKELAIAMGKESESLRKQLGDVHMSTVNWMNIATDIKLGKY